MQEASGLPVEPAFRDAHHRDVAAVRAALGEGAFTAAWKAGTMLPLDEAIADASTVAELNPRERAWAGSPAKATPFGLTPRELDVLGLLAEGRTDKEIGTALFISHRTAMNHVARILAGNRCSLSALLPPAKQLAAACSDPRTFTYARDHLGDRRPGVRRI